MPNERIRPHAGKYRHRVEIQAPAKSYDSEGQQLTTWTTVATVWAEIIPLTGREYFQAKAVNAEITHRVVMRYRRGMKTTWRLLYGARALEIISIADAEENHVESELLCREVI